MIPARWSFTGKSIPSLWREKHPAIKGLRPLEHRRTFHPDQKRARSQTTNTLRRNTRDLTRAKQEASAEDMAYLDYETIPLTDTSFFHEVIFHHRPTRTLFCTDSFWSPPLVWLRTSGCLPCPPGRLPSCLAGCPPTCLAGRLAGRKPG